MIEDLAENGEIPLKVSPYNSSFQSDRVTIPEEDFGAFIRYYKTELGFGGLLRI